MPKPWEDLQHFDDGLDIDPCTEPPAAEPAPAKPEESGPPQRTLQERMAELERLPLDERCRRLEARLRRIEAMLSRIPLFPQT